MKSKALLTAALCLYLAGCSFVPMFARPTPPASLTQPAPTIDDCECQDLGALLAWSRRLAVQYGEVATQLDGLAKWARGE